MTQKQKYEYLLNHVKLMRGEVKAKAAFWEDSMIVQESKGESSTMESAKMTTYKAVADYIDAMLTEIGEK